MGESKIFECVLAVWFRKAVETMEFPFGQYSTSIYVFAVYNSFFYYVNSYLNGGNVFHIKCVQHQELHCIL